MKDFNTDANTHDSVSSHFLVIDGQRVPLTDELQKLYNREIYTARNRARREHSCACTNYKECNGDCSLCRYHKQGIVLSTDDERYGDGYSAGTNKAVEQVLSAEDEFMAKESLAAVMRTAANLVKNGDTILLMKAEGQSERQIAAELGLPRTTIQRQLNKLIKYLNEHRSDYIDW